LPEIKNDEMSMISKTSTSMINNFMRINCLPCLPAGRRQAAGRHLFPQNMRKERNNLNT
jgi:hypothetical protein